MSYNYFEDTKETVDPPEYLSRSQLARSLADSMARETELLQKIEELKGEVYSLQETITGLLENYQSA